MQRSPISIQVLVKTFVLGPNHGQYMQALGLKRCIEHIFPNARVSHFSYRNQINNLFLNGLRSGTIFKYLMFLWYWNLRFNFVPKSSVGKIVVYGSDMIWHLQSKLSPPDPFYFEKQTNTEYSISYAPSTSWRDPSREPAFIKNIDNFNSLSVRDYSTLELANENTSKNISLVCDPAFFLREELQHKQCVNKTCSSINNPISIYGNAKLFRYVIERKYLFLNYQHNPTELAYFSRKNILRSFGRQLSDPLDVFKWYYESSFIFASTFHGFIFALITQRPFIVIANENVFARIQPYLKFFDKKRVFLLESPDDLFRTGNYFDNSELIDTNDVDYSSIDQFVTFSREWLRDALSEALNDVVINAKY